MANLFSARNCADLMAVSDSRNPIGENPGPNLGTIDGLRLEWMKESFKRYGEIANMFGKSSASRLGSAIGHSQHLAVFLTFGIKPEDWEFGLMMSWREKPLDFLMTIEYANEMGTSLPDAARELGVAGTIESDIQASRQVSLR
jgi:hypothetical protein